MRGFAEDMTQLARSRRTQYVEPGDGTSPPKTWFAADMVVQGNFLSGTTTFATAQADGSWRSR